MYTYFITSSIFKYFGCPEHSLSSKWTSLKKCNPLLIRFSVRLSYSYHTLHFSYPYIYILFIIFNFECKLTVSYASHPSIKLWTTKQNNANVIFLNKLHNYKFNTLLSWSYVCCFLHLWALYEYFLVGSKISLWNTSKFHWNTYSLKLQWQECHIQSTRSNTPTKTNKHRVDDKITLF